MVKHNFDKVGRPIKEEIKINLDKLLSGLSKILTKLKAINMKLSKIFEKFVVSDEEREKEFKKLISRYQKIISSYLEVTKVMINLIEKINDFKRNLVFLYEVRNSFSEVKNNNRETLRKLLTEIDEEIESLNSFYEDLNKLRLDIINGLFKIESFFDNVINEIRKVLEKRFRRSIFYIYLENIQASFAEIENVLRKLDFDLKRAMGYFDMFFERLRKTLEKLESYKDK